MRYIYYTNNTQKETQRQGIKNYLSSRGIYLGDCTTLLCDFKPDSNNYDIGIKNMLTDLQEGDVVYVWDLSVLAKNLDSLYTLLLSSSQLGISIVQCIDGEVISSESSESLAFINGIGFANRYLFQAKSRNSKKSADERKQQIQDNGGYYNKKGQWVTHLGAKKGTVCPAAIQAMHKALSLKSKEWKKSSIGYNWVMDQLNAGVKRNTILEEFNRRHRINPKDFSAPKGGPIAPATLSRWIKEKELEQNGEMGKEWEKKIKNPQ